MQERVNSSRHVLFIAPFHDDVENGIHEQVDHEDGQNVRVEIDAVHRKFTNGEGDIAASTFPRKFKKKKSFQHV